MLNQQNKYTIGGSVPADNKMYVTRQADHELYHGLKNREFCYVLNARQMGKSSLRVRVVERLKTEGIACVNIDITEIVSQGTTQEQLYAGFIDIIIQALNLSDFDLNDWWEQHGLLSPVQHLSKFFDQILSARSENIVIFIDEIDAIRQFGPDFFALIRACYNRRADNSAYHRLTFAILGVASPGDLIADKKLTPFNIGKAIELTGFQLDEALPLAQGLAEKSDNPQALLQIVLDWTGGQPFLTQKLCDLISQNETSIPEGQEVTWVKQLVQTKIVTHWESKDEPIHLRNISGRILYEGGQKTGRMLGLYQQILQQGEIPADDSREQLELRLSGLVVRRQNSLLVYNKIYTLVFNQPWVETTLTSLRPYAESFNAWIASQVQNESYLLRGQALQTAQDWANNKSLSEADHRFLNASQALEEREAKKALTAKAQTQLIRWLTIFLIFAIGLIIWAISERYRAIESEQVAEEARQERTASLFESQLTHASLLARSEDYAAAKKVLAESRKLDSEIMATRRHARNLLAGFTEIMGGAANKVYEGAGAALFDVAVSPDGKLLATAGENGTLVLFDVESGQLVKRLEGHDEAEDIWTVVFHPQGKWLASAGDDKRIILWTLPEGEKLVEWQAPSKVKALAVSPDGNLLASGGGLDKYAILWDPKNGEELRRFRGYSLFAGYSIPKVAFNSTGALLAGALGDGTTMVWNVQTGKKVHSLAGHSGEVFGITFSPYNKLFATGGVDKSIRLWHVDIDARYNRHVLRGHQNHVFDLSFVMDGNYLVSASRDQTLRTWDTETGITTNVLQGHSAGVIAIATHEEQIFSASNDGTVRRWDMVLPQRVVDLPSKPFSTAMAPDGNSVAVGFEDGALRLYSLPETQLLWESEEAHTYTVTRLTFNAEGHLLASASHDNTAKLWQVQPDKLQEQQIFTGHKDSVHAVAFSPDSKTLATASYDGQIGLFTVGTEEKRFIEKAHEGDVMSVAFDNSGTRLLSSGNEDRATRLWNLNTNPPTLLQAFPKAQDMLMWASLSPDNHWVASVGRGLSVDIYATQDAQEQYRLVGHEQAIYRAIFSPDSQQVATVGGDATVKMWDLSNGSELFSLRLPTQVGSSPPLWDFDFRCLPNKHCWIAVPLTRGKLVLYDLGKY